MAIKVGKSFLQKLIIVGILFIIAFILGILSENFFTFTNFNNVARQVSVVIISGCAVTLLMISGNIDLSVGSNLALAVVLMAKFAVMGMPLWLAIIFACLVSGCIGFLNGVMVVELKISSVIATLGTMYIARGMTYLISGGKSIVSGIPTNFGVLGRSFIGPIQLPIVLVIVVIGIFFFIESKTIFGKYAFAIGGNKVTAMLSGIDVKFQVIFLYILVGIFTGFAGTILASRMGVGEPAVGIGFEFDVIVAVILGGTTLTGGEGSVIGMVIGAFIVGFLANGLNLMGVNPFYQYVLKGIVLIFAVLLDIILKEKMVARISGV
jgi:ribose/xylose/arabinose/galactoside ABC-type transport system permease subunit